MPSSRRIIAATGESMARTLAIATANPMTVTASNDAYAFIMCKHPRRKRVPIDLVSGDTIGFLCQQCDGAVLKDDVTEIIANAVIPPRIIGSS